MIRSLANLPNFSCEHMDLSLLQSILETEPRLRDIGTRYEFRQKIAEGGIGSVFLALGDSGQRFAVKVILLESNHENSRQVRSPTQSTVLLDDVAANVDFSSRPHIVDRSGPDRSTNLATDENTSEDHTAVLEAEALSQLDHPGIPKFHEIVHLPHLTLMIMEYIEGETLRRMFQEGLWVDDRELAVRTILEVVEVLEYVHARGLTHLDLKPRNLMRDSSGTIRVLDFGAARAVHRAIDRGAICGTPLYMSPEHTGSSQWSVGPWSDLYSIGAILYDAICGSPPFEGDRATEVIKGRLRKDPVPPRDQHPDIPPLLEQIVMRLLAKSPDDRYQTVPGLRNDLEYWLATDGQNRPSESTITIPVGTWDRMVQVLQKTDPHQSHVGPETLVGREQAFNKLDAHLFETEGTAAITLVRGHRGLGKTRLMNVYETELNRRGHRTIHLRCIQRKQRDPVLIRALREAIRQIAEGTPVGLEAWRSHLSTTGPTIRMLISRAPHLSRLRSQGDAQNRTREVEP
ncbi:MAG: protein kinase [Bradymonadaceae bacterium]